MSEYGFVEKLYGFARSNGYKINSLRVGDRRNYRGCYKYVEVAFVVMPENAVEAPTMAHPEEVEICSDKLESELKTGSEEPESKE